MGVRGYREGREHSPWWCAGHDDDAGREREQLKKGNIPKKEKHSSSALVHFL